jgi:hypothetical protein
MADKKDKLEDFGEKIGGARKDWAAGSILAHHLSKMTQIEVKKSATKAYVWPTPDFEAIEKATEDKGLALEIKVFRDLLPAKAEESYYHDSYEESAELYVEFMAACREMGAVRSFTEGHEVCRKLNELFEEMKASHGVSKMDFVGYKMKSYLSGGLFGTKRSSREAHSVLRKNPDWPLRNDQNSIMVRKHRLTPYEVADGLRDELKASWAVNLQGNYWGSPGSSVGPDKEKAVEKVRKAVADKKVFLFKSEDVAWDFACRVMASAKRQKDEAIKKKRMELTGEGAEVEVTEAVSSGRAKKLKPGQDATPEMIMEEFGFRGGEFGNWTNQGERQEHLNQSYESLHAMAEVLGVPPDFIGLEGTLAIAFGARGRGGANAACAHYEPGRKVINLTRFKGAGSLAHEWFHAFDHFLTGKLGLSRGMDLASEQMNRSAGLSQDAVDALGAVLKSIKYKTLPQEEQVAKMREGLKTRAKGLTDWINSGFRQMVGAMPMVYFRRENETEEQAKVRDELARIHALRDEAAASYLSELEGATLNLDSSERWQREHQLRDELYKRFCAIRDKECPQEWVKKGRKRNEPLKQERDQIEIWSNCFTRELRQCNSIASKTPEQYAEYMRENGARTTGRQGPPVTKVFAVSKEMDKTRSKPYFTQPCELLARGFEAYMMELMDRSGMREDYLVRLSKQDAGIYANGEERKAVTEAFERAMPIIKRRILAASHKEDFLFHKADPGVELEWNDDGNCLSVSGEGECHLSKVKGLLFTFGDVSVQVDGVGVGIVANDNTKVKTYTVGGYIQGYGNAEVDCTEAGGEIHLHDDAHVRVKGRDVTEDESVSVSV